MAEIAFPLHIRGVPDQPPMIDQRCTLLVVDDGPYILDALANLLDDPFRSVRIQAASSLTSPLFPPLTFSQAKQKSFAAAAADFRRSLELEGDHPNVQVRLGSLESTLGNKAQAREAYRRAIKINPAEADAYVGLALLDMDSDNREEALRNARKAVQVSGKEIYRKFLEKIGSR